MKAIVYTRYGGPDVLRPAELDTPVPADEEVLIRVHAAEATKADCELRRFRFAVKWFWLPLRIAVGIRKPRRPVLGGYFAGVVEAAGANVSKLAKGDAVFGCAGLRMGANAEYLCLPASATIVPKPDNMSFEEAAAVPLGGLNALHFMRRAEIKAGQRVLVNGAGGSIGTFAVQIAKTMGAEVTAVDSAIKKEMLRGIGADRVLDYETEDFAADGRRYDVILSMVAGSDYGRCIGALEPDGRYLMANPRVSDMLRSVLTSRFTDKRARFAFAGETEEELLALKTMIEAGTLRAAVDRIYPMERTAEAHERVEAEHRLGCVVLSFRTASGSGFR